MPNIHNETVQHILVGMCLVSCFLTLIAFVDYALGEDTYDDEDERIQSLKGDHYTK
jgi:hypothetical protein